MNSFRPKFLITYPWDKIFRVWGENITKKYADILLPISRKMSFKVIEIESIILRLIR